MELSEEDRALLDYDHSLGDAHKTSYWLRQHRVPHHRIHQMRAVPVSEDIKSMIEECRPAPPPEGVEPPRCECGLRCQCVYDEIITEEGDPIPVRVWVCGMYNCFFLQVAESDEVQGTDNQCEILQAFNRNYWDLEGVLGEVVLDQTHIVDRYVTLWHIIGFWGKSFAADYFKRFDKLRAAAKNPSEFVAYAPESRPMTAGLEYDGFISYSHSTKRTPLHLSFLNVFGMNFVMLVFIVIFPLLAVGFYFAVTRNVELSGAVKDQDGKVLESSEVAKTMAFGICLNWATPSCYWYWFQFLGPLILITVLLLGGQAVYANRKFFLDRYIFIFQNHFRSQCNKCIHHFEVFYMPDRCRSYYSRHCAVAVVFKEQ